jgi:glycosyltransferase involved in cell wall biosynthesis
LPESTRRKREITVVIPTRQRRDAVGRALAALEIQTLPADAYEVVVSVDGSTDGTLEMLDELELPFRLQVASTGGRGRAVARNVALALAEGEMVVILDDDMQVVPEFLERHLSQHPAGSRRCVMGAVPVQITDGSPHAARHIAANFEAHLERLAQPDHVFAPRDFYSGNFSIPADLLREVGGFDENFDTYGNEDVELGVRLRAAGVDFAYDARAEAQQEYAKQLHELAEDTLAKGVTTVLLARTHPDLFSLLRLAAPSESSRPWLAARSVLLWLTRRWTRLPGLIFRLAQRAESAGLWRQPLFYRAVLDYAFWAGVDRSLARDSDGGPLALLGEQLHRGPLSLLLH